MIWQGLSGTFILAGTLTPSPQTYLICVFTSFPATGTNDAKVRHHRVGVQQKCCFSTEVFWKSKYRQTSNISRSFVGNDHSDIFGASTVGATPTTSSFSTSHLASRDCAKPTVRWNEKHLSFVFWCALYQRFYGNCILYHCSILKWGKSLKFPTKIQRPIHLTHMFFLVLRTLHVCYPSERINHFHKSQNAAAACAQCSTQNTNVHVSVLNGEFWDMEQVCSEICELGQLYELNTSPFTPKVKKNLVGKLLANCDWGSLCII